jgi:hypothetical protein
MILFMEMVFHENDLLKLMHFGSNSCYIKLHDTITRYLSHLSKWHLCFVKVLYGGNNGFSKYAPHILEFSRIEN